MKCYLILFLTLQIAELKEKIASLESSLEEAQAALEKVGLHAISSFSDY